MLSEELKKIVKGDVIIDDESLQKYSRDASLFEIRPEVIVAPKDVEDIKAIVKFVAAEKRKRPSVERGSTEPTKANVNKDISITVRSAGTDMTGGPLNDSIILDVNKHLTRVLEVGDGYAITEPGVFYRDFERETLKTEQIMPSYPASREICSVGGMVANNAGGEKTLYYGKTQDFVMELKVVLADGNEYDVKPLTKAQLTAKIKKGGFEGELYEAIWDIIEKNQEMIMAAKPNVHKNSAGYYLWDVWNPEKKVFDLSKLIVGSQGTLGIVTQIKFRLVKIKKHDRLAVIFLKNLDILGDLTQTVLKYEPENFESYDDQTLKMGIKYIGDVIKVMKTNALKLMFSFIPEFWAGIKFGGIPKLILLVEFTGDDEAEIDKKVADLAEELKKYPVGVRITKNNEEEAKYWTFRRESFNLLRHHLQGKRTAAFIDDIVVRPEFLPEFIPQLRAIMAKYPIFYTMAGHVGDGNFHIIPLMDMADPKSKDIIINLSKEVYDLVLKFNGSIDGEHNDGIIRTPFLEQMFGKKVVALFAKVKKAFDPKGIFNPMKKVGADMKYLADRIINRN